MNQKERTTFAVLAIFMLALHIHCEEAEVVKTESGDVVGKIIRSQENIPVSAYYGIPYAEPPVGSLRFAPPIQVRPWTGIFNASNPKSFCVEQLTEDALQWLNRPGRSSENCLELHVFAPYPKPKNAPVVVYIHGGGFTMGSSMTWVDHTVLPSQGVITVAMNYRLGVFGFFSLGNKDAPGSLGLLDQLLAMRWAQKNIAAFGGDSSKITLWGASAGSASVGFHLLSPASRGLFQRAIMISGSPLSFWAFVEHEKMVEQSQNFLKTLGCVDMKCLREKSVVEILNATFTSDYTFVPTLDGTFLLEPPEVSVNSGNFNRVKVLIGNSVDEGGDFLRTMNLDVMTTLDGRIRRADFLKVIKRARRGLTDLQARALDILYTDWTDPDNPYMLRDAAMDIFNDGLFICDINTFADTMAKSGMELYRYVFDYKTTAAATISPDWIGSGHASEQTILIGDAKGRFSETPEDVEVRQTILKHFLDFIRTGDVNENQMDDPRWPYYKMSRKFKRISISSAVENNFRSQECARWEKLLPLLNRKSLC